MRFRTLWLAFGAVVVLSFAVLGWTGVRIYQEMPPIPARVVTTDGEVIIADEEISLGQNIWQSIGGMEVGSIWGHGSYVAPDWTADWLHREAMFILNTWSGTADGFATLPPERQAELQSRLQRLLRTNTYNATSRVITVDPVRAQAFEALATHYADVFTRGREVRNPGRRTDGHRQPPQTRGVLLLDIVGGVNQPTRDEVTYTSNWPHEPLIGNRPTPDAVVWTGVSIILLLAGIGAMAAYHASIRDAAPDADAPANDPLLGSVATPSQRAVVKYFWVVSALILVQILLGVVAAHYGVEGSAFYGIPIAEILPYSIARTWHVQLGIFWIATTWLAAGLYIGPAVSGVEPKWQRLGVNVLFAALLIVVVGSLAGQWLSVKQILGTGTAWFYLGHSGYEYIDLGRLWQILLLVGLFLWLALMVRAIRPALQQPGEQRPLLTLFLIASIAIAAFYMAALGYGRRTNLAMAEYWRWWVVHLWVEGFFEVFATVVIAFLFARLKLVRMRAAGEASILAATIFLSGGIIGTLHHLYFSGTPTLVLGLGSVFSALEVVPLLFVGFEAWENLRLSKRRPWVQKYRWPIYFFVSVAFWNLVGAGLFGFMINPPIALYYMQGLNTTPVHGHAALFGVYGMLGIGLMLFSLRALDPVVQWKEGLVSFGFWATNIGLFAMVTISLLPVGLMQTWASVEHGYWYARSPEFLQNGVIETFRWLRVIGDTIFAAGSIALAAFVIGLRTGGSTKRDTFRIPDTLPEHGRL